MKKRIFSIIAIVSFISIVGNNRFIDSTQTADPLILANIEALASGEGSGVSKNCAGDSWPNEYGCYADNHGSSCGSHGDCRR